MDIAHSHSNFVILLFSEFYLIYSVILMKYKMFYDKIYCFIIQFHKDETEYKIIITNKIKLNKLFSKFIDKTKYKLK